MSGGTAAVLQGDRRRARVCEGAVLPQHCGSNRTPQNQPCMRWVRLHPSHSLTCLLTPPSPLKTHPPPRAPPPTRLTHARRCGMKVNMAPFYYLLERGVDPVAAYQRTYKSIMRDIEFRTWYRGQPLGDAGAWGGLRVVFLFGVWEAVFL